MWPLNTQDVKTVNYAMLGGGEFVPVDASRASVTITLPTAPGDKTLVGVTTVAIAGSHTVAVSRGGSTDVFNISGGPTALDLSSVNEAVLLQYYATGHIWYVLSGPVSLNPSGAADLAVNETVGGPSVRPLSSFVVMASPNTPPVLDTTAIADGQVFAYSASTAMLEPVTPLTRAASLATYVALG